MHEIIDKGYAHIHHVYNNRKTTWEHMSQPSSTPSRYLHDLQATLDRNTYAKMNANFRAIHLGKDSFWEELGPKGTVQLHINPAILLSNTSCTALKRTSEICPM